MCKDDYPPILAELEKESFHAVLDCGCGTGPMPELLHEKYPDKHYVGLDLTPEMIAVAQSKGLSNTEFVAMAQKAGFRILTMEAQKNFRAHLVARK